MIYSTFEKKVDLTTLENICHDITSLSKEVADAITYTTVSLTTFAKVMGLLSQPVIICDANRIILYVNEAFENVVGYTSEEVVGKTPDFLYRQKGDVNHIRLNSTEIVTLEEVKEKTTE